MTPSPFRPLPIGTTPQVKRAATRLMKSWVAARDAAAWDPDDPVAAFKQAVAYDVLVAFVASNGLTRTVYDPRPRT